MFTVRSHVFPALIACMSLVAPAAMAGNGVIIGVESTYGIPMDDTTDRLGLGLGGTIGYQFDFIAVKLIPEIGATYFIGPELTVPRIGGRAVIGWIVSPGVYAHFATPIGPPFATGTPGADAGLTLELSIPRLRVGAHAGVLVFGDPLPDYPRGPDTSFMGGLQLQINLGKITRDD